MNRYKKVDVGHGRFEWVPIYGDEMIPKSDRSVSDGEVDMATSYYDKRYPDKNQWGTKTMKVYSENTENLVVGDRVILQDHQEERQGNSPGHFFWVPRMNKYIGTILNVTKLEVHGIRADDWGDSTGFNYFWVKKINILDDEMFEI